MSTQENKIPKNYTSRNIIYLMLMRFIKLLLLFFYLSLADSDYLTSTSDSDYLTSTSEQRYYARYINESEWIEGLGQKVNAKIDTREQKEMTSVCYYLGINC